jgi:dienelactone hydrolase
MIVKWFGVLATIVLMNPCLANAQGLTNAATQVKDLTFPTVPSTVSANDPRMTLLKPDGSGPFPAIVLHHQCAGLRTKGGPNRSMVTWAQEAVRRGFVVLLIDSLGPRGVDDVCAGPKGGVNFARGVRDAMQAADHLRALPFVDKRRVAHIGFSSGAMAALLASNSTWRWVLPGSQGFSAAVAVYPGCFTIKPKTGPDLEIVQNHIDRPVLVLMGDKDVETPPHECVPKLQAAKEAGAPVEWYVFPNATHCWDCEHLSGFSKKDWRGTKVVYRYNIGATQEASRRIFEFLERTWAAKVGYER